VEANKAIFEECLLAKDPLAHLASRPASPEKQLMMFLLQPHRQDYREQLSRIHSIDQQLI
jgi:hypothetical protein